MTDKVSKLWTIQQPDDSQFSCVFTCLVIVGIVISNAVLLVNTSWIYFFLNYWCTNSNFVHASEIKWWIEYYWMCGHPLCSRNCSHYWNFNIYNHMHSCRQISANCLPDILEDHICNNWSFDCIVELYHDFFVESTFNEICNISTERGFWLMVASVLFYCAFCCTLSCSDSFLKIVKNRWRKDEVLSASTLVKGRTVTVALVCSLSYVMFWSPFYIIENAPDNYAWSDWLDKLVVNRRLVTIFIAVYKSYHLWML